jgi:hypothetical protein
MSHWFGGGSSSSAPKPAPAIASPQPDDPVRSANPLDDERRRRGTTTNPTTPLGADSNPQTGGQYRPILAG